MALLVRPFWSPFSAEFRCRECGSTGAYRSRPRGFFEMYVLPIFFLQPVRCDRCYLRSYVPRSFAAQERPPRERMQPKSRPGAASNPTSRLA